MSWSQGRLFGVAALLVACLGLLQDPVQPTLEVLVDSRIPLQCSSPGWEQVPYDISVLLGSYVHFDCQSSITHSTVTWLYKGRTNLLSSPYASKAVLSHGNRTLMYGPISSEDDGISIGCEVTTTEFGKLPSDMGTISVITHPGYSPKPNQVAIIGQPFYLDFGYTLAKPPTSYRWRKNGKDFTGDGERVITDHTGVIFARVVQEDAGQYTVVARNGAGEATAQAVLRVTYWFTNTHVQTGSSGQPSVSTKLALTFSINFTTYTYPDIRIGDSGTFHISDPDSTSYAMQIIRTLLNPATEESLQQAKARLISEDILRQMFYLLGLHYNATISDESMDKIHEVSNCTAVQKTFNCHTRDVLKYRTIDGTCNNFFYPLNGAAGTAFARILPAVYEDRISRPVGHSQTNPFAPPWPSPRLLSWRIIKSIEPSISLGLTHMFMQWGQFLDHDLDIAPVFPGVDCGCNYTQECIPIHVHSDDVVFGLSGKHGGTCLPFVRSVPACECRSAQYSLPRNQINQLTSYIDASNVYGFSKKLADGLRLFRGGLLKQGGRLESAKGNLPFQEDKPKIGDVPFFVAGDERVNEQVALTVMHTIWMREHNRIARKLGEINPCWNDEKIYQETRKIVGAQMQVITYNEFLPVLFGIKYETYVQPYTGYNPFIDASIPNSFASAAFRFGHSLVKPQLLRLDKNFRRLDIGHLPLERAFFNPLVYFESGGTDPLLRGLLVDQSNPTDEFLNRVLTSKLFAESTDKLGMDLASLNIQRGRDHGTPSYRSWQRFCERVFPGTTASFRHSDTVKKLKELYGEDGFKNGMDLWVGGLSEEHLPIAQVGPTFACILGLTFSRLRDGDRFWYESPYVFTPAQRFEIKRASLSKVLCTNADDIPEIQRSAFIASRERVNCQNIPEVNLSRWWDRQCFFQYYLGDPYFDFE